MSENKEEIFVGICGFLYFWEQYKDKFILLPIYKRYGLSFGEHGILLKGMTSS